MSFPNVKQVKRVVALYTKNRRGGNGLTTEIRKAAIKAAKKVVMGNFMALDKAVVAELKSRGKDPGKTKVNMVEPSQDYFMECAIDADRWQIRAYITVGRIKSPGGWKFEVKLSSRDRETLDEVDMFSIQSVEEGAKMLVDLMESEDLT